MQAAQVERPATSLGCRWVASLVPLHSLSQCTIDGKQTQGSIAQQFEEHIWHDKHLADMSTTLQRASAHKYSNVVTLTGWTLLLARDRRQVLFFRVP